MAHTERENFYRNSTLIVDHANEAFKGLLEHDLTKQGLTLLQFIKTKQHEIYHLCYNNRPCCMCPPGSTIPVFPHINRILNPAQLNILLDTTVKLPGHNQNRRTKHCCCPANPNINYDQLDLTLTRCILVNFTTTIPHGSPERLAVDELIKFRNESYGHATKGQISDHDYQINKAQIEKFLMVLAKAQGRVSEFKQKLSDAAVRPIDETILRQYQTVLMENVKLIGTLKKIESAIGVKSLPGCLTKDLCDVTVTEGRDAHFEIWTKEYGLCSTWLRDGVEIVRSEKFITGKSGKIHSLDIRSTLLSDKGLYTIRVTDIERHARLNVEEYFTKNLQSVECIEGETAEFICEVIEDSLPARWNKNKINLENDIKYEILQAGKVHRLSIKNCDQHDTAIYTVNINNRLRATSLAVIEYFTKPLGVISSIEGETVQFDCEVLDDNQTALWFKDGTKVCTSDKYITESYGKRHRLVVSYTKIDDRGEYSVKIKNCIRHTRLNVQEYFTHNMKRTIECVEGHIVELSCAVLEVNVPAVWMRKGVVVQQSAKYKIEAVGMLHKLSIIGADRQDSGEYTVTINNRIRSSSLLVKEIPAAIHQLSEKDKDLYLEIIKAGTETRYYIRIVIIGENGVGKTCLLRRLLGETIDDVESTDGIDIVHKCKIRLSDGKWVIDGGSDKRKAILSRIKMAVNSKSSKDHIQEKLYSENDPPKTSGNASVQEELHYQIGKPKISEDVHIQEKLNIQSGTLVAAGRSHHKLTTRKESRKTSIVMEEYIGNRTEVIGSTSGHESDGVTEAHLSHVVAITSGDKLSQLNPLQVSVTRIETKLEKLLTAPVLNELSEFLNDIGKFDIPEEVLVDCGFWDFAGQRHYYATHPIFLNSNAVHLLVANIMKDIKQIDTEDGFDKIGEYVDFWFDSVHLSRDIETKTENSEDQLDPPVIVVCTGIDSCKDNLEERKKEFRQQLLLLLDHEDKMNHLRRICWVSNTKPSDTDFNHLRQSIFEFGKTMKIFGEKLPLKWIQLERLLDIIREAGVNIVSWPDMSDLSSKCSINEEKEITLFLKYQHKIGSIIYFESLKESIILNPKWLADAFRCLVSDKFDSDITITSEWKMLEDTGKLEPVLIEQLFQKDPHLEFFKHQRHLLNVMELFGIIVKVTTLLEDG